MLFDPPLSPVQVEADLASAQPAIDAALLSLKGISPGDIASLRTAQSPPGLVKRIMDGVLILLRLPIAPPRHDMEAIQAAAGCVATCLHARVVVRQGPRVVPVCLGQLWTFPELLFCQ